MSLRTPSINNICFSGNIVREPEVRQVGSNNASVCTISVANNHRYLGRDNNWQEIVTFADVELWNGLADKVEKHCHKGSPVIIEGQLRQINWKDKDDKNHSKLQIRGEKIHILNYPDKK